MLSLAAVQTSASPNTVGSPTRLLVIDGHSYAYRAFFAIRHLSSPSGRPTNAIYGFIRMLGKVLAAIRPSHVVVVWDGGLASERMELLPDYKAQRDEMPSELRDQLDPIVSYLKAMGITSWMKDGVEADDCIAALTRLGVAEGLKVVIASSDKDFMQLVGPGVGLLNPNERAEVLVDVEKVKAKTGVGPTQIVDWLSLVGDAVDNIPGVPGVGPKTASNLLQQFGSIDELYHNLSKVSSERVRMNLEKSAELVRRNQKLVRLNEQVGCQLTVQDLVTKEGDYETLRQLYSGWGFKTLLEEVEAKRFATGDFFEERAGK